MSAGFPHNPYNGVVCNDTITATGVFGSKELWRLAKGKKVDEGMREWGRVIPSKVNEESAVLGHVEELLQGVVGAENEFEPP